MSDQANQSELTRSLEAALVARYGLMLPSSAVAEALGYRTRGAFLQALARGTVPVPTFKIEHRRGRFALARDIAQWMSTQRGQADRDVSSTASPAGDPSSPQTQEDTM